MSRDFRKRKKKSSAEVTMPSLVSLIDLLTVLLVYLIKTFSVSPITVQDPSIQLPISTSQEAVEDSVVVMITGAERRDADAKGKPIMVPEIPTIAVDDDVLIQLGENYSIPTQYLERQFVIRPLKQRLLEVRKQQGVTAELGSGEGFSGKIVFVVDRNVPYRTLSRALVSSAEAGYDGFKFAIVKRES